MRRHMLRFDASLSPIMRHQSSKSQMKFHESDMHMHTMHNNSMEVDAVSEVSMMRTTISQDITSMEITSQYGRVLETLPEQFYEVLVTNRGRLSAFDIMNSYVEICEYDQRSLKTGLEAEKWLFEEQSTWRLLHILMEDRLNYEFHEDSTMADITRIISEKEVMQDVFNTDTVVRQSQLIVDWLESCEATRVEHEQLLRAQHFTDKTLSWENTILQLKEKDIPYASALKIVSSIDPDAPVRQKLPIHELDAKDEIILLEQILQHIRCGQLELAQKLCEHCGQPWRAATLEGWKLYHNPNLSDNKEISVLLPTEGNPHRDVWKLTAWNFAEDKRMPPLDRTVYATLCGNLQVALSSMAKWKDWLWIHLKVLIDVRIEEQIRERCPREYVSMPSQYWKNKMTLPQVFSALAASTSSLVRQENGKEFPTIQRFLILDDMNSLYSTLAAWGRQIHDFENPNSVLLLRFVAHLVLVLRELGKEMTEKCYAQANEVLIAYVRFVMTRGDPALVMLYISTLAKVDQVDALALYLERITDREHKSVCLELAANHGLDAQAAAEVVVERIRTRERVNRENYYNEEQDVAKIEALDWLVVYPSQFSEALWQANALVRQFVASGKLDAAKAAYKKLPPDLLNGILQQDASGIPQFDDLISSLTARQKSAVHEYLALRIYLDAKSHFSEWFKYFHKHKPVDPGPLPKGVSFQKKLAHEQKVKEYHISLAAWKQNLKRLSKTTRAHLFNVLTFPNGGWLQCTQDFDDPLDTRQQELEALSQLCIPEIALLIHEVHLQTGEAEGCIQLVDLLASEQYKLYQFFSKEKLREFLSKVTEASVELMKNRKDPWGHQSCLKSLSNGILLHAKAGLHSVQHLNSFKSKEMCPHFLNHLFIGRCFGVYTPGIILNTLCDILKGNFTQQITLSSVIYVWIDATQK